MKRTIYLCLLTLVFWACNAYKDLPEPSRETDWKVKKISAHPQTPGGDANAGFDFLKTGNYIGSGVPIELVEKRLGKYEDKVLEREGVNANMPYIATAFAAKNGEIVVNGNCFTCHAGKLNGEVVVGLGDSFSDFRRNMAPLGKALKLGMRLKYGKDSEEWTAYEDFSYYFAGMAPYIKTNQPGVNPAAHLAEACVAYRDPETLTYTEEPLYDMPDYVLASDVPPLWNVDKKNALYYTAVGRGDFTKLLFQASVLGISDSAAAREAVNNFKDVVAWLESLEPPVYPAAIDESLAEQGKPLFEEHCSGCHGTYGTDESYPNKVVSIHVVKTDPYYATYAMEAPIVDWYNQSWFATSQPQSWFEPEPGYVAPPLDGIWATAPYLHNGSVPTLADLLNSPQRPMFWERSGRSTDYDYQKVGWKYTRRKNNNGKWTYDTTIPGYHNTGHTFGDDLTDSERKAVIEYLKTL